MNKHVETAEQAAVRWNKSPTCGYGFVGPLRVKFTKNGYQYFINHIEVNKEYANWFMEYVH